jgi:hypothetical protein
LDIARDLGWKEGAPVAVTSETEEQAAAAAAERGGGSGMGVSVSVMSPPPEEDDESASRLHTYAMREDVAAMSAYLQAGEGLDIDARDEYVSVLCVKNWRFHVPTFFSVGIHGAALGYRSRERRHNRAFTQARR